MLSAISLLDRNLRDVPGSGQDELRMSNAILASIRHTNDEWLKRYRSKQIPNAGFHCIKRSFGRLDWQSLLGRLDAYDARHWRRVCDAPNVKNRAAQ